MTQIRSQLDMILARAQNAGMHRTPLRPVERPASRLVRQSREVLANSPVVAEPEPRGLDQIRRRLDHITSQLRSARAEPAAVDAPMATAPGAQTPMAQASEAQAPMAQAPVAQAPVAQASEAPAMMAAETASETPVAVTPASPPVTPRRATLPRPGLAESRADAGETLPRAESGDALPGAGEATSPLRRAARAEASLDELRVALPQTPANAGLASAEQAAGDPVEARAAEARLDALSAALPARTMGLSLEASAPARDDEPTEAPAGPMPLSHRGSLGVPAAVSADPVIEELRRSLASMDDELGSLRGLVSAAGGVDADRLSDRMERIEATLASLHGTQEPALAGIAQGLDALGRMTRQIADDLPAARDTGELREELGRIASGLSALQTKAGEPDRLDELSDEFGQVRNLVAQLAGHQRDESAGLGARIAHLDEGVGALRAAVAELAAAAREETGREELAQIAAGLAALQDHAARAAPAEGLVEGLADELAGLRDLVAELAAARPGAGFDDRFDDLVRRLDEVGGTFELASAEHLDAVAAELVALRDSIGVLAEAPAPVDFTPVLGALAEQHAALAARLDGLADAAPAGALDQFGREIGAMRQAMHAMPAPVSLHEVEGRLEDVAAAIDRLASRGSPDIARPIAQIEERLDGIAQAVVALSLAPSGNPLDPDVMERLEARLTDLASRVDRLAAGGLSGLAPHLEAIERTGEATLGALEALEGRVAAMAGRLDALPAHADLEGSGAAEIAERLDALVGLLDRAQGGDAAGLFEAFREEIGRLDARFDALAGQLEAQPAQAAGLDPARFEALEAQLSHIVGQIETLPSRQIDLEPITRRLEGIEEQVAISRDIAFDVARRAAEEAASLVVGQVTGGEGAGLDPAVLERLMEDLQAIDRQVGALREERQDGLSDLQSAMIAMTDRLGSIEATLAEVGRAQTLAEVGRTQGAGEARSFEAMSLERMSLETMSGATVPGDPSDASPRSLLEAARASAARGEQDRDEALPVPAAAPDLPPGSGLADTPLRPAAGEMILEPSEDDAPLEPGAGMPDLSAMLAGGAKRRGPEAQAAASAGAADPNGAGSEGGADFLANLRRDAQLAAADAVLQGRPEAQQAQARPARLGVTHMLRNRTLMSVAALAIVVIGIGLPMVFSSAPSVPAVVATGTEAPEAGATAPAAGPAGERAASVETDAGGPAATAQDATLASTTPTEAGGDQAGAAQTGSTEVAAPAAEPAAGPLEAGNPALRQAAASGNGRAMFEIGRRFTDGVGVEQDPAAALSWYERAAKAGYAPAQYRYANFLENGLGTKIDTATAAVWYRRAAQQGNALAMHNLGVLYSAGAVDGRRNMTVAVDWFERAAELGIKDSQVNLGIIYANGFKAVEVDLAKSYRWFAIAARGGDQDAASKRDVVAKALPPADLERARAEADLWKPKDAKREINVHESAPEWDDGEQRSATLLTSPEAPVATTAADQTAVARAQAMLGRLGYDAGPADGRMGERTRNAIRAFQRKSGMAVDGEVSGELLARLGKAA